MSFPTNLSKIIQRTRSFSQVDEERTNVLVKRSKWNLLLIKSAVLLFICLFTFFLLLNRENL